MNDDLGDYRQRMKEKFEKEQGGSRQGTGILGGLFQTKEPAQSNQPLSDFELAKQLQESEMKNMQQGSQNVYDYRNGNPGGQAERNEDYRPPNFPVSNDIELNDFSNPHNKRSDTIPLRSTTTTTRPRGTWFENQIGLLSSQIKDQMTPTAKYCCYIASFFTFLIFLVIIKSL